MRRSTVFLLSGCEAAVVEDRADDEAGLMVFV
jgi:hypothetical protein